MATPASAGSQSRQLNGGTATIICYPKSGIAAWVLEPYPDNIHTVSYNVAFSNGYTDKGIFVQLPKSSASKSHSSGDKNAQWVWFSGSALGLLRGYDVPAIGTMCDDADWN